MMEEFYTQIRSIHIGAAIASGALFLVRASAVNLSNAQWPLALPVRIASWTIDTTLLTAALMLMTIVQQFPFIDSWLTMKVLLVIVYVVLGWFAFRAKRKAARVMSAGGAIAVFAFIVTIARAHQPLGIFSTI